MPVVEFQEENFNMNKNRLNYPYVTTKSKLVDFLISKGLIKNEGSANKLLLTTSVVILLISIFIIINLNKQEKVIYNLPENIINSLPQDAQNKIYDSRK